MRAKRKRNFAVSAFLVSLTLLSNFISPSALWANETPTPDSQVTATVSGAAASVSTTTCGFSVRRTEESGDASLYVNLKEVLKIRSTTAGLTPVQRATLIQERLQQFMELGGNPRDIKPGQEGSQVVIRAGETALVTVDGATAQKTGLSRKQLAFHWANLMRQALGADPLDRDPALVASRGFSPAVNGLRNAMVTNGPVLKGYASWYGPGFHGRRTASGERFDMHALTAAHRSLPMQTLVKVTNMWNGKSALVRITDRGPFVHGRIIDLSKGAAQAIGMLSSGTAPVSVEVVGRSR